MKTKFIKEKDRKNTFSIFEVIENKETMTRSIVRFICDVGKQQTQEQTEQLADFILEKLNKG
jgi:hypothetical protein